MIKEEIVKKFSIPGKLIEIKQLTTENSEAVRTWDKIIN